MGVIRNIKSINFSNTDLLFIIHYLLTGFARRTKIRLQLENMENSLGIKIKQCGIVKSPRDLKAGDIIEYKETLYFFSP